MVRPASVLHRASLPDRPCPGRSVLANVRAVRGQIRHGFPRGNPATGKHGSSGQAACDRSSRAPCSSNIPARGLGIFLWRQLYPTIRGAPISRGDSSGRMHESRHASRRIQNGFAWPVADVRVSQPIAIKSFVVFQSRLASGMHGKVGASRKRRHRIQSTITTTTIQT